MARATLGRGSGGATGAHIGHTLVAAAPVIAARFSAALSRTAAFLAAPFLPAPFLPAPFLAALFPPAVFLAALLLPAPAGATEVARVWYRSGEGCPDASEFLRKVERRAANVRLAGQGDAIDFVVTLSNGAAHGWGRVERQTSRGTVAIRELEAASCDVVADGLALSLALAIEPAPSAASSAAPPDAPVPLAVPAPSEPFQPPAPAPDSAPPRAGPPATSERARSAWRVGLQGGLSTLIHDAVWSAGPFVELAPASSDALLAPAFRFGAFATLSAAVTADVDVQLLAARLEACAWGLALRPFELRPCAGLELGALAAERAVAGAPKDTTLWGALLGHLRAACTLSEALALEAQAGLSAGLGRHEFIVGTPARVAARSEALGLSAGVGASWRLP